MASEDADRQLALSLANELDSAEIEVEDPVIHCEPTIAAVTGGPEKLNDTLVDPPSKTMGVNSCTQTEQPSFATCLQQTRQSLKASDVTVICGNEVFKVHRAVICAQSTFFKAALSGGFMVSHSYRYDRVVDNVYRSL